MYVSAFLLSSCGLSAYPSIAIKDLTLHVTDASLFFASKAS
jgi:hypothetical protein